MGKQYEVPETLTIMKAMEYAGYQFIRGCGCRGGVCGACATVYRKAGRLQDLHRARLPDGGRAGHVPDADPVLPGQPRRATTSRPLEPTPETIYQLYPELFRCVACNACTKVCPMDVEVLDYISAAQARRHRGRGRDLLRLHPVRAVRQPLHGRDGPVPHRPARPPPVRRQARAQGRAPAEDGRTTSRPAPSTTPLAELKAMAEDELKKVYTEREMEPAMARRGLAPRVRHARPGLRGER